MSQYAPQPESIPAKTFFRLGLLAHRRGLMRLAWRLGSLSHRFTWSQPVPDALDRRLGNLNRVLRDGYYHGGKP